jgi:hypothetical protein
MAIIQINLIPTTKYVSPETAELKIGDCILFAASKVDSTKSYIVTIKSAATYFDEVSGDLTYHLKAGELAQTPGTNTQTPQGGIEYIVQCVSTKNESVQSDAPPKIIILPHT